MSKPTYLSAQLRESAPYLRDIGWQETADLLIDAAAEIEELRSQFDAPALIKISAGTATENEWRRVRTS